MIQFQRRGNVSEKVQIRNSNEMGSGTEQAYLVADGAGVGHVSRLAALAGRVRACAPAATPTRQRHARRLLRQRPHAAQPRAANHLPATDDG